ncbi:MAG: bifunctional [glutamine synthetase] adenylyltransferase/[glutamine synthetase]-adenylyl-L-tyrosine phosphorylase [Henriciella sp.]
MAGGVKPLSDDPISAIDQAQIYAPYLQALVKKHGTELSELGAIGLYDAALSVCHGLTIEISRPEVMRALRQAKAKAHLAIAALDLSGLDNLQQTTKKITDFADASVTAALRLTLGWSYLKTDGLFIAALGKMGAYELNYSSDIDMAVFFDPDRFDGGKRDPGDAAVRATQAAMQLLNERTADGYVFRTDLRLRPDPSSNPLAVSTSRASIYYESVGQNWERMVWIKGRHITGDKQTSHSFFEMLEPFVWRRHLDYWAIADVHAIKNMINAKAGPQSIKDTGPDVKLGVGGIREIEFFVQTQQVILGGRNPALRVTGTLAALSELVDMNLVSQETGAALSTAYDTLRKVEHRIQMLGDKQTHRLPQSSSDREDVAALCGFQSLTDFDAMIAETRAVVHGHYLALFSNDKEETKTPIEGNLVFTGVDDDPGTVTTLQSMGFNDPGQVIGTVRRWHRARTPATRSQRGREMLTALLPSLLRAMSETGEPDQAFTRFGVFLDGLRSGVQTLAMLLAEPNLMRDLVVTLALAPRIGQTLARRPGLLEALLSVSDRKAKPEVLDGEDFETAINKVRRWHGEQSFLIGHQLLHGAINARDAAEAWTGLAEPIIELCARIAETETVRRFGDAPGKWCVMALGKLGGREMTAGSDLDLLVIYDAGGDLDAQTWFTRFTQRLISALSAETAEGSLYEVDMRLRPSGRSGPVATSITAFERYHRNDAWTWEHMSLTRLSLAAGDTHLGSKTIAIASDVIADCGGDTDRKADILDMRRRLWREKPPNGAWDLKTRAGGLIDLEFIVQQGLLVFGKKVPHSPHLKTAIKSLGEVGYLTSDEVEVMGRAFLFLQALQQIQRLAVTTDTPVGTYSEGLASRLCRAVGVKDFTQLEQGLEAICEEVTAIRVAKIGALATEN